MLGSNSKLTKYIDDATSDELKAPDSNLNILVIENINSRADVPKIASKILKKKLV